MRRGLSYATCLWCVAFGAPHLWWALGWSYGFPGGQTSYELFMSSAWRYVYDGVVVVCSALGFVVALALLKPPEAVPRRWIPNALAWIACGLLTLRGGLGLIVDRFQDLVWDPAFLAGGVLFGGVAWLAGRPAREARPA